MVLKMGCYVNVSQFGLFQCFPMVKHSVDIFGRNVVEVIQSSQSTTSGDIDHGFHPLLIASTPITWLRWCTAVVSTAVLLIPPL